MQDFDQLIMNKVLLTREKHDLHFSNVKNMSYKDIKDKIFNNQELSSSQLDNHFTRLSSRGSFDLFEAKDLMIQTDHIEQFYWEVRLFMKESFSDVKL